MHPPLSCLFSLFLLPIIISIMRQTKGGGRGGSKAAVYEKEGRASQGVHLDIFIFAHFERQGWLRHLNTRHSHPTFGELDDEHLKIALHFLRFKVVAGSLAMTGGIFATAVSKRAV